MREFASYLSYLTRTLLRSFYLYVSIFLYFLVLIFMIYILPVILDLQLIVVSRHIYFFVLIIFFAIFNVVSVSTIIFRQSIDDGSELILQSKPLRRTTLVYCKIMLFVIVSVVVACLSSAACIFASFTFYGGKEIARILSINILLGTIVIYCCFGGISILICMFFKQITTIIATVSIFLVMMFYSMLANEIFMSVSKYLNQHEKLYLDPVSLVLTDNKNNLSYHGGAVGSINVSKNYINSQIFNEIKPNADVSPNQFLQYKWDTVEQKTNFIPYLYTNLVYQLASIYTEPPESYLLQPFANLSYLLNSSNSFNLKINFNSNGLDEQTKAQLITFNYNQNTYVLTNSTGVYFAKPSNLISKLIKTDIENYYNNGPINYFTDQTPLPIGYDIFNNKVEWTTIGYDTIALQQFIDQYFSDEHQLLIKYMNSIIDSTGKTKMNPVSYYVSLFNTLTIQQFINDKQMTAQNYTSKNNIEKILSTTAIQLSKFQYLSSLCLQNSSSLSITEQQKALLANALMLVTDSQTNSNVIALAFPMSKITSILEEIKNNPSKITNYLYITSPLFSVIELDNLLTFNFVSVDSYYNMTELISGWIAVSAILLLFSIACYFRHDFY